MTFNSFEFILFAILFYLLWPVFRQGRNRRWFYLAATSFFFYGWWDFRFLPLMAGTGLVDYYAGMAMIKWPRRKRLWLVLSIGSNVGSLAVFKYLDFLIRNANWTFDLLGIPSSIPVAGLILPIGISFYTFQSMSYTIDIYRGKLQPAHNVLHFFAYLALFPQLVAGPIVRAADLLPQLDHVYPTTEEKRWQALQLVALGFFKKVVVADSLAATVNHAFAMQTPLESAVYLWAIMVMFAFQIYCDFSGYSDIARGLARWMGYELMVNFDHPYISTSFREFWSRWHISLSTWFRDYVYIPLGGSRDGRAASYRNLWITMLVSGLWHGANWTYVVWGGLHALYITAERATEWPARLCARRGGRHAAVLIVFVLTLISWVFFRAQSFGQAGAFLAQMFDFRHPGFGLARSLLGQVPPALTALMIARQAYVYFGAGKWKLDERLIPAPLRPVAIGLMIVACIYLRGPGQVFIYFQF
jgi:D-alanyl-lipoteichoic acid acyltransferase DltB (MBOAT superfamily)